MRLFKPPVITIILIAILFTAFTGCQRAPSTEEKPDTSSYHPEPTPATDFERQMDFIRGAHFKYVWVFSRPDGQIFTKEDGEIFRKNTPKVVDRVAVDGGKQYITGSNFDLEPAQKAALKKRFKVEDYSGK
jgi:hypothetical protein